MCYNASILQSGDKTFDQICYEARTKPNGWAPHPRASIPSYSAPIPPNAKLPLPPPMKQETWSHLFFRLICPVTGAAPSWAFRVRKTNHLLLLLAAKATNFFTLARVTDSWGKGKFFNRWSVWLWLLMISIKSYQNWDENQISWFRVSLVEKNQISCRHLLLRTIMTVSATRYEVGREHITDTLTVRETGWEWVLKPVGVEDDTYK